MAPPPGPPSHEGAHALTERAFRAYGDRILTFLYRLTGDLQEAESFCQETFLRLLRSRPVFPNDKALRAWLYRVARNLVVDESRRKAPSLTENLEALDRGVEPDSSQETREEVERMLAALATLPPLYRHTLTLRFLEERDYTEIAEIEDVSESALRTRVQKGLSLLREAMAAGRTRTPQAPGRS